MDFPSGFRFAPRRPLAGAPEVRQIVGRGRQRQLHRRLPQSASSESPHPSLLLQHSDHRFSDRFPPLINQPPGRVAQSSSHPAMRRILVPPQPAPRFNQRARSNPERRRRCPPAPALLTYRRRKSRCRHHSSRCSAARPARRFHRQQRLVVIGLLRHALRQNHVILAHRQRGRVSQRVAPRSRRKRLSGSVRETS